MVAHGATALPLSCHAAVVWGRDEASLGAEVVVGRCARGAAGSGPHRRGLALSELGSERPVVRDEVYRVPRRSDWGGTAGHGYLGTHTGTHTAVRELAGTESIELMRGRSCTCMRLQGVPRTHGAPVPRGPGVLL